MEQEELKEKASETYEEACAQAEKATKKKCGNKKTPPPMHQR